jgi:hypothetical protein
MEFVVVLKRQKNPNIRTNEVEAEKEEIVKARSREICLSWEETAEKQVRSFEDTFPVVCSSVGGDDSRMLQKVVSRRNQSEMM